MQRPYNLAPYHQAHPRSVVSSYLWLSMESRDPQRKAPILSLSHDILWSIFRMNTDLFEEKGRTLDSIRAYSQVCKQWRDFTLASPSLWGRVIDLRSLRSASPFWRQEVIRRSWDSVLWIKGYFPSGEIQTTDTILQFLYGTLENEWHRVQKLDIVLPSHHFDLNRCRFLFRPAPKLEIFRFGVLVSYPAWSIYLRSSQSRLFADDAPLLREFNANKIPFSLKGPWLSNLRTISIGYPVSIEDVVRTLQMTPRLETLELSYPEVSRERTAQRLPNFTLPTIKYMCLFGHLPPILTLLEHVKPSDGCCVDLTVGSIASLNGITSTNMNPLKSLGRIMRGYLRRHNPEFIDITRITSHHVSIYDASTRPKTRILSVQFNHWKMDIILMFIFASYQANPLITTNVRKLELDSLVPTWNVWASYLSCFTFVDSLCVHNNALQHLLWMQTAQSQVLFPCLKVLIISEDVDLDDVFSFIDQLETSIIVKFLRNRFQIGHPIKTLDLSNCGITDPRSYVARPGQRGRYLTGLEVIYPERNYEDRRFY